MAWLEKRGNLYRVVLQIDGLTYKRSLGIEDEREAAGRVAAIERRIKMVESGELVVPDDSDVPSFLLTDGKTSPSTTVKNSCTVKQLVDQYIADLPACSIEKNSLYTLNIHLAHIVRVLTPNKSISRINFAALQDYVNKRSSETGRRGQSTENLNCSFVVDGQRVPAIYGNSCSRTLAFTESCLGELRKHLDLGQISDNNFLEETFGDTRVQTPNLLVVFGSYFFSDVIRDEELVRSQSLE